MLKNVFRVLSANGIVAIIGFFSSLFLPKVLSIDEYAEYQTFVLYLSYIAILHLGFPSGMNIKYAGTRLELIDKKQYKAEMRIVCIILCLFSTVAFIVTYITKNKMLGYVSLMIFPYCFLNSFAVLLQAWGRFQQYAVLHIVMSALPHLLPIIIFLCTGISSSIINIYSYLFVFISTTIIYLIYHASVVRGIKSNPLLTKENWNIEKIGIFFLLGNYINLLIHSVDKQFVNWFCTTSQFSYYSFALIMQNIMTIFITAISQPLFPYMALGKLENNGYTKVKRFLFLLGSFSGIAYLICEEIIRLWIPNFIESLSIIRVYFCVFPAMSVINSLYFNMYKTRKMAKRYIIDLLLVLICAVVANTVVITIGYGFIGISFVTTLLYYIWLFYGTIIFKEMKIDRREGIFLSAFIFTYIAVLDRFQPVVSMLIYFILILIIFVGCFPSEAKDIIQLLKKLLSRSK